jgi:hypothetical protein
MRSLFRFLGWTYVALCVAIAINALSRQDTAVVTQQTIVEPVEVQPAPPAPPPSPMVGAAEWFRRVKPYCNAVEISVLARQNSAPRTVDGAGYDAACHALAGRIDDARRIIDRLPQGDRVRAAAVVFDVGHPVADAGDDRSAGPIMELVVDYWPTHYMALYHAGMSEYMLGQRDLARKNLTEFLRQYRADDGWTTNAKEVLRRLETKNVEEDLRRPREPGS